MLAVNSIMNVNNTPNNISFKGGVQSNYGVSVPPAKYNMVEGGLVTGFLGTIGVLEARAEKIKAGLNGKIDYFA